MNPSTFGIAIPDKIHGTHARTGKGMEVAWASSLVMPALPQSQLDLAEEVRRWMDEVI